MTEEHVDSALRRADRLSKVIALFAAMGVFGGASLLTDNVQFNASVAAFAGIGVRIYIPYHSSISGEKAIPSQALDDTGNYHHGAVGIGLIVGALAALLAMSVESSFYLALATGIGAGAVSYLVLRVVLPS